LDVPNNRRSDVKSLLLYMKEPVELMMAGRGEAGPRPQLQGLETVTKTKAQCAA
jgi:hypothetical protein